MEVALKHRPTLVGIQFARAVAAIMVVLFHASRMLPQYVGDIHFAPHLGIGYAGVDFFFVLSGFIIFRVHGNDIDRPSRLGHYAFRRFSRIYPIYWVAFALALAILAANKDATLSLSHVMKSFLLFPESASPVLGVSWTLCHEVAFYAVFAILIASRKLGFLVMSGCAILFLMRAAGSLESPFLRFLGSSHHLEFAMGAGAAYLSKKRPTRFARSMIVIGIIALLGLAIFASDQINKNGVLDRLMYGSISTWVIYALAVSEEQGKICFPQWSGFLGSASYSLYLFHIFLLGSLGKVTPFVVAPNTLPVAIFFVVVGITVAGGCLIYYFVERPLMKIIGRGSVALPPT